ncbi:MAG: ABC transporter ATP-binding protein [Nitrososphaerales archaeon]
MSDAGYTEGALVATENLIKWFPITGGFFKRTKGFVHAVDGVNLQIPKEGITSLVGESGCGKSTLGRLVLGLLTPDRGKILFEGQNIVGLKAEEFRIFRRKAQIVFQDPESSLNPRLTVGATLKEALRVGGKEATDKVVGELLVSVGLEYEHQYRYPRALSGGQKQRVGIARALAVNPKFIVLDEPVSSLDVSVRAQIVNLLLDLQKKYKLTYLFISHDLSLVKYISDYVAVMYLGVIVEKAPSRKFLTEPLHPYSQALLSSAPRLQREVVERIILKGDVPSSVNIPKGCRFHTRCPKVMDKCRIVEPQAVVKDGEHEVYCHLYT